MKLQITKEQFETARQNGIPRSNVKSRVHVQGFSLEDAITLPLGTHRNNVGKTPLFTEEEIKRARFNGINKSLLLSRYEKLGYTKEEAITLPIGKRREKTKEG